MFTIKAISISDRKGVRKKNIDSTNLITNFGLENDAHGGRWHRQVSFLAQESIDTMRAKGLDVVAGNFAENITTEGGDLTAIPVGTHLNIGETELIISQLGKICHARCAIYHQAGDCVMPKEGIFGVVLKGGSIKVGDSIKLLDKFSAAAAIISTRKTESSQGEEISQRVMEQFQPAFIRFDVLTDKEGGSLTAILQDLTTVQKIKNIVIIDPTGGLGLNQIGWSSQQGQTSGFEMNGSTIHYHRSVDDLLKVAASE